MNISIIIGLIFISLYFLCSFIFAKDIAKRNKVFLILSFLTLFIILYLREPFSDLKAFLKIFNVFHGDFSKISITRYGFLYKLLNIVVGKIWLNERFFIVVVDFITLAGPFFIIKRYSKNYLLSVLLFVALGSYGMQFYVIRQSLAISFLLFSIKYIEEKKLLKFLLLVIIAGLFHTSAFLFVLVYFLQFLKFEKKTIPIWIIIILSIVVFKRQIAVLLLDNTEYSNYVGGKYDAVGEGGWKLLLYLFLFIFSLLFKNNYSKDRISSLFLSIMLFCMCFQLIATSSSSFVRVANYFVFSFYLLPINVIEDQENKNTRFFIKLLVIIFFFVFVYLRNPINGYSIWLK